ncbi:uncharacterized protein LOC122255138 [Penaeus japonicus]|uniref:uncharacterized protein LOC122255138 n=1 Tax=Penaeus japonicus TaxID=27405 RepID=UPI001C711283|nr:uncharacterized protein LOC122255138 [Penaeus japonicus]
MDTRRTVHCIIGIFVILATLTVVQGQIKRCFACRSRGNLGDCKDPFRFNSSHLLPGVSAEPCASGWCSKRIEGKKDGKDHDLAIERQCLQRSPPDDKERCAEALVGHRKIFICFCYGDLCNSASGIKPSYLLLLIPLVCQMLFRT